jgi:hypothetical protein
VKMTVVTTRSGELISTYRPHKDPGTNDPVLQIHAGPDCEVQEVELPDEYWEIESPEELHRRVREHLRS